MKIVLRERQVYRQLDMVASCVVTEWDTGAIVCVYMCVCMCVYMCVCVCLCVGVWWWRLGIVVSKCDLCSVCER